MAKSKGIKNAPSDMGAEQMIGLAWQAFGEGRYQEAQRLCESLTAAMAEHAHAWYLRGLASAAQGQSEAALSCWDQVKNAPDLLPDLAQGRGRVLLAMGRLEEALAQFQDAMTYQPDNAANYYFIGLVSLQQGALADARRYFRQASVLDPQFGQAHYELGVLALHNEQYPQALTAFKAAVEHMPQSPEAANNLALSHQALGDVKEAEAWFRKAVKLKDSYAEAWFNLGLMLRVQGSKKAEACIDKALKLNPALRDALPHD